MLKYRDSAEFFSTITDRYGNDKEILSQSAVEVVFLQSTAYLRNEFQENVDADAVLYANPKNQFIIDNYMRLEGMYVRCVLYNSPDSEAWYKVTEVAINRDHLLENKIDNVECLLKKTRPLQEGS